MHFNNDNASDFASFYIRCRSYGKNDFAEGSKILLYTDLKIRGIFKKISFFQLYLLKISKTNYITFLYSPQRDNSYIKLQGQPITT